MMPNRTKNILLLIVAGEAVFFLPFVLVRIFRPTYLDVFQLTNFELGSCFTVYGVVAMLSYALGGPLADRFRAATLMALAIWFTAIGGVVQLTVTSVDGLRVLYGFWGFTTIFLFWSALIKATRMWGATEAQGTAFGLLDGGRGMVAVLIGVFGVSLFAIGLPGETVESSPAQQERALQQVILSVSVGLLVLGALIFWGFDEQPVEVDRRSGDLVHQVRCTLADSTVWLLGMVVLTAYTAYKITDYIPQLTHELLGFSQVDSARLGTFLLLLRPLCALAFGFLADRWVRTAMLSTGFVLIITGAVMCLWILDRGMTGAATIFFITLLLLSVIVVIVGTYGARALYFAVMRDSGIPLSRTGTAAGFISVVGFTPDVFVGPVAGWMLDSYPGSTGYMGIFGFLTGMAAVGLIASRLVAKRSH